MLEIKELKIRMETGEKTLKSLLETKNEEIGQLQHRLRVYEDENKRLSGVNHSLQSNQQY